MKVKTIRLSDRSQANSLSGSEQTKDGKDRLRFRLRLPALDTTTKSPCSEERPLEKCLVLTPFLVIFVQLSWVFHGEDHLLDTEDPQQLTSISSLPLESCKPLKIKCADRVRSAYDFAFPGPAIMLEFFVPNGPVDGLGVSPRENAALSSTEAKTNYGTDAYTPERLAKDEGFKPLFADNSQTAEIFAKFPAWEKAFSKAGKLTTLPLIVNPASGFESEQMAWFIVTPPYCTYPYIQ